MDRGRRHRVELNREQFEVGLRQYHICPGPDCALRELLALCRTEGIPAGLIVMPESSEHRSWYPAAARAELAAYLDRLKREFHVPLIDARCWIADADFYDSHHLWPRGAATFTRRFQVEALEPFLQGKLVQGGGQRAGD
jgi:hypothetical protein